MANAITLTTLKRGADSLNIEFEEPITKKELETIISEAISKMELGYECPTCGKDIPDVDICPFCNESFNDEGEGQDQEEMDLEADALAIESNIPDSGKEDETSIPTETNKTEFENPKAEDKTPAPAPKVNNKKKQETKPKVSNGIGSEIHGQLLEGIGEILEGCETRMNTSGITYLLDKKRILKVAASAKSINIEFNVELETQDDSIKTFTADEAKAKHLGTVRAIYTLGDLQLALNLVKEAYGIRKGLEAVAK